MTNKQEEDIQELVDVMVIFDKLGDGKISPNQLGDVLRAMHQNPTEQEIEKCGFSKNPDARISIETLFPIVQTISKNRVKSNYDDYVEAFKMFDRDQNGFIGSAELRHVLTCLGEKLNDDEVTELLAGQEDSQGNIQYEEFIKMVMNG